MTRKEQVWVIDDDHAIRWVLEKALQRDDMTVRMFESATGVLDALIATAPTLMGRSNPQRTNSPPATGIAITL